MVFLIRFVFLGLVLYFLIRSFRRILGEVSSDRGFNNFTPPEAEFPTRSKSPFEVLNLSTSATQEEIKKAYKDLLVKYHPDKVAHLGEDLQKLAQLKTAEISWAYNQVKH